MHPGTSLQPESVAHRDADDVPFRVRQGNGTVRITGAVLPEQDAVFLNCQRVGFEGQGGTLVATTRHGQFGPEPQHISRQAIGRKIRQKLDNGFPNNLTRTIINQRQMEAIAPVVRHFAFQNHLPAQFRIGLQAIKIDARRRKTLRIMAVDLELFAFKEIRKRL